MNRTVKNICISIILFVLALVVLINPVQAATSMSDKQELVNMLNQYKNDCTDLQNEVIANVTSIISSEIDHKNHELQSELTAQFNKYSQDSLRAQENLIKEVRDFKRVLNDAYYTQEQVENENTSFIYKLLKKYV